MKKKSVDDLKKFFSECKEDLRQSRFKVAASQLKNVREIRKIKRNIARVNSLLARH
jgi:ribosomal protein L29